RGLAGCQARVGTHAGRLRVRRQWRRGRMAGDEWPTRDQRHQLAVQILFGLDREEALGDLPERPLHVHRPALGPVGAPRGDRVAEVRFVLNWEREIWKL